MRCDRCGRVAIIHQRYSGLRLCAGHFLSAVEARAKQTIRARGWIRPGDRIAVGLSGGPASCSLLHFLTGAFGMRRDLSLLAITVDEGDGTDLDRIRALAEGRGIEWMSLGLAGGSGEGSSAPGIATPAPGKGGLLDDALESLARDAGATKLALGTSLDTRAGWVFLQVLRGDGAGLLGGTVRRPDRIPRIEPFVRIPSEEISLYGRLGGLDPVPSRDRETTGSLETEAGRVLREYTARHPSAMFSLANLGDALVAGVTGIRPPDPFRRRVSGQRDRAFTGPDAGQEGRTHG